MESSTQYLNLRSLIVKKILESKSPIKPSKSKLLKESDERLVSLLFENAVMAEREFWREDIIKKITSFEPDTEKKLISSGTNLLTSLIEVVEKNRDSLK
jgi:hypothetical protein